MGKERLFMPILILFMIIAFTLGFLYFYRNIHPITSVLSKKDVVCGELSLIEAIELTKGSSCTDAGVLNEDRYLCNYEKKRLEISMDITNERRDMCSAFCYISTDTKEVSLEWMCRGLLE